MKKMWSFILLISAAVVMTACSGSRDMEREPLRGLSFSGENEVFSVYNGVLVLGAEEEICYGGYLKAAPGAFEDIRGYTVSIYLGNREERLCLMSNSWEDMSGACLDVSGELGKLSGDISGMAEMDMDKGLWIELETSSQKGEKNCYELELDVKELTEGSRG